MAELTNGYEFIKNKALNPHHKEDFKRMALGINLSPQYLRDSMYNFQF